MHAVVILSYATALECRQLVLLQASPGCTQEHCNKQGCAHSQLRCTAAKQRSPDLLLQLLYPLHAPCYISARLGERCLAGTNIILHQLNLSLQGICTGCLIL